MIQIECHSEKELTEVLANLTKTFEREVNVIISRETIYIEASDNEDQEYVPFIRSWEKKVYTGPPDKFDIKLLKNFRFFET